MKIVKQRKARCKNEMETTIVIPSSRVHLHEMLELACGLTAEGDFVPATFVNICMQELAEAKK